MLSAVSCCAHKENIALEHCLDRVLAQDVVSPLAVPPEDNSAMDGYALNTHSLDLADSLAISQRIPAGVSPKPLAKGTAARIFTGAPIPEHADAVVMQEDCEQSGDKIKIMTEVTPRQNIRAKGQDIAAGDHIASVGEKLRPQHIGLIASVGKQTLSVYKKLRVAIISTGDELAPLGAPLKRGQIYNSNQYMLHALASAQACQVHVTSIVADNFDATRDALASCASDVDLIISSGGVSVGEEDYVKRVVDSIGQLALWKIKIKPGKPIAFGHVADTPFVGLPGNPVSAFVTFLLFVVPIIHTLQGRHYVPPQAFLLPANFTRKKRQSRPEYARARMSDKGIDIFPNQSSGVLTSVCWADALAHIPENETVSPGDLIEAFPLNALINS